MSNNPRVSTYLNTISEYLKSALQSKTPVVSISKLVPGIAFREIWPLETGNWSPLSSFRRRAIGTDDTSPGVLKNDFIPRKYEIETAQWLLTSIVGEPSEAQPRDIHIVYVGDSLSDITLAENLCLALERNSSFARYDSPRIIVSLYLYNPGKMQIPKDTEGLSSFSFDSWSDLESACRNELDTTWAERNNYLLLDVDRTILMPRGMCDQTFVQVGQEAFASYARRFSIQPEQVSYEQCEQAYNDAGNFPPYSNPNSPLHSDEDTRALGALLLGTGLVSKVDFSTGSDIYSASEWIIIAKTCIAEKINENKWRKARILDLLDDAEIAIKRKDCSISPIYREEEEIVMLRIARNNGININGHIVNLVSEAVTNMIIPIAYSDRPGASMGLTLRTYFRSRPRVDRTSLINADLPLIWEG